jgi:hypothetical protein
MKLYLKVFYFFILFLIFLKKLFLFLYFYTFYIRDGNGEFKWKDGDRYVGLYKDDKKHG